jgi:hypothetical protein
VSTLLSSLPPITFVPGHVYVHDDARPANWTVGAASDEAAKPMSTMVPRMIDWLIEGWMSSKR